MKVGVIGAGTMGGGIAQASAQVDDYKVYLCDLTDAFTKGEKKGIEKGLTGRVAKGKLPQEEMDKILSCAHTGTKDICKGCDPVIEAVIENAQIEKQIFKGLSETYKKDYLFATNTSSLPITEIGAGLDRSVTGMHFFNPAPIMKLAEATSGLDASQEGLDRIMKIAGDTGKTVVPMQEFVGFVVNHILIPMINETIGIHADNNVPAEKIDEAMKLGADHPMGSLALSDLIGLDVVLTVMEVLQSETGDMKYRPYPELRKMVRGDRPGRKIDRGFHDYTKQAILVITSE